jgi:hypothetical protein
VNAAPGRAHDRRTAPAPWHLAAAAAGLTAVGDPADFHLAVDLHVEAVRARVAGQRRAPLADPG